MRETKREADYDASARSSGGGRGGAARGFQEEPACLGAESSHLGVRGGSHGRKRDGEHLQDHEEEPEKRFKKESSG